MSKSTATARKPEPTLNSQELTHLIEAALDDDKAEDIMVIPLNGKSTIADYLIIATGRSARQVGAMADHVAEKIKKTGTPVIKEGLPQCDWVLLDAGDVVIHLFRPEVRAFYNIEKMWGETLPPDTTP